MEVIIVYHHIINRPSGVIVLTLTLTPLLLLQLLTSILLTLSARVLAWTGVDEETRETLTGPQARLKVGHRPAPAGFHPRGLSLY